ncbi:MAG TPA: hypothetical protein VH482_03585 [Thermomicrobiales bacterium]|jgi:hypothetical protein
MDPSTGATDRPGGSASGEKAEAIYQQLLAFLARLDENHVPYALIMDRPEGIMVQFAMPGVRWEVEFMTDGRIDVERFYGTGVIEDETALDELWQLLALDRQ